MASRHRNTTRRARIAAGAALTLGLTGAAALLAPADASSACDQRQIDLSSGLWWLVDDPGVGEVWISSRIGTTRDGFEADSCASGPAGSSARYVVKQYDDGLQYEPNTRDQIHCIAPQPASQCFVLVGVDSYGGEINDGNESHDFPAFTWECGIHPWRVGCWTAESPVGSEDHRPLVDEPK